MATETSAESLPRLQPNPSSHKSGTGLSTGRPRLEGLTSLRFFAALHVILFHLNVEGILTGGPWWYRNFAGIGYIGVNFFFVLSGFILVYTYAGTGDLSPLRFWRARLARIYPAYLLSLAVSAPFFFFTARRLNLPFFSWSEQHLALASILTIVLLQSWVPQGALAWNPVCWSLSDEAFFYSAFPFLLNRIKTLSRRLLLWIAAIWLISLTLSLGYVALHPDGAAKVNSSEVTLFWRNVLSFNPLVRLPEFVVGMFTCRLFLSKGCGRAVASVSVLTGVAGVVMVTIFASRIPNPVISTGLLSPAFAAIIYGVAAQPRWTRFLALPPLVYLGEASYSLYLLHSYVISNVSERLPHLPLGARVGGCVAVAVAASLVSYRFVEQPGRRLLRP